MHRIWTVALGIVFVLLASSLANAQATRTFVSGVGNDANPCSRTAPCRTFAGAIVKTGAKGEINVLDPGGFGGVTITKSISIISDGNTAGVLVTGGNGITINALATDVITLRGLDFNGTGLGSRGIAVLSAGTVHVENCLIRGFTQDAIDASVGSTLVTVKDTLAQSNGRGFFFGAFVNASLDNVRSEQNGFGVRAVGTSEVVVRNSVMSGNTGNGIAAVSTGAPIVNLTVENTIAAHNGAAGVLAQGNGASVNLSNTTIANNVTGISAVSMGHVLSFGNNRIIANTTNGAPTATVPLQ
jgi:parallel beta helix pectate lyase-like protein